MYSVASPIWNEIAETQQLRTSWAQQVFPLPDEQQAQMLHQEEDRLAKETDSIVAAAYLKVMPLLWENEAISRFKEGHPELEAALPEILTVPEAVIIASRDLPLDKSQQAKLTEMLQKEPT